VRQDAGCARETVVVGDVWVQGVREVVRLGVVGVTGVAVVAGCRRGLWFLGGC
jgi:hypothetical protein